MEARFLQYTTHPLGCLMAAPTFSAELSPDMLDRIEVTSNKQKACIHIH